MVRNKFRYKDISVQSRKTAGVDGFTIRHVRHGIIATVHINDIRLINTVDKALEQEYGTKNVIKNDS